MMLCWIVSTMEFNSWKFWTHLLVQFMATCSDYTRAALLSQSHQHQQLLNQTRSRYTLERLVKLTTVSTGSLKLKQGGYTKNVNWKQWLQNDEICCRWKCFWGRDFTWMCLKLKVFLHLCFTQVNEGKAASVTPETMKTEPDSKAKGEKSQLYSYIHHSNKET